MATLQQQSRKTRGRSAAVSQAAIDQVGSILENLPDKPKDTWTLKDAMTYLQGAIEGAITKGYSLDDIAEILTHAKIPINTASLRYYLTQLKRQATTEPSQQKQSRQPRTLKSPEKSPEEAIDPRPALSISKRLGTSKNRRVAEVISFLLDEPEIAPQPLSPETIAPQRKTRSRRK